MLCISWNWSRDLLNISHHLVEGFSVTKWHFIRFSLWNGMFWFPLWKGTWANVSTSWYLTKLKMVTMIKIEAEIKMAFYLLKDLFATYWSVFFITCRRISSVRTYYFLGRKESKQVDLFAQNWNSCLKWNPNQPQCNPCLSHLPFWPI